MEPRRLHQESEVLSFPLLASWEVDVKVPLKGAEHVLKLQATARTSFEKSGGLQCRTF